MIKKDCKKINEELLEENKNLKKEVKRLKHNETIWRNRLKKILDEMTKEYVTIYRIKKTLGG